MQWVRSNGRELTVRPCGPVSLRLLADERGPLPIVLDTIEDDHVAHERVKALMATGLYSWERA
jgi:hypothetical protein